MGSWPLLILASGGKLGPEHRQTTLRLGLGCFVLQNVQVFGEQAVGHADDIGGDPIPRPSGVREPAVDNHVITVDVVFVSSAPAGSRLDL